MNVIDRARFLMFGDAPRVKGRAVSGLNPFTRILLMLSGKQPVWTGADFAALSQAGYQNCMTVYACVRLITQAAAGIEWLAKDKAGDTLDKHPALDLLNKPNDRESRRAFVGNFFGYRLLAGNSYVIAGRVGQQPPLALWLPRPDRMKIIPGSGPNLIGLYRYRVGSDKQDFEPQNVLHSKLFHPTDDWYGLSPLSVASHGIDISNMADDWNAKVLTNDMRPPGALSTDGKLTDESYARLRDMVRQEWQGFDNIGNPLILEEGLKWVQFSLSPKDMDWLNSKKTTKREICTVFNVDPCLIGDSEYATYSNKIEARRAFYQDNILPAMFDLRDELNAWLMSMYADGARLEVDREGIDILQEEREKKFAYLAGADWLTVNEKRKATGFEDVGEEGDVILVPIGKIPLNAAGISSAPGGGENGTDEPKSLPAPKESKASFWSAPERKRALWDSFVQRVEAKERSIVVIARKFLQGQAGRAADKGYGGTLSENSEARLWRDATLAWYVDHAVRAGRAGVQAAKGEVPAAEEKADLFNLTPDRKIELDKIIIESGTKIARYTMEMVRDILATAEAEKWTVEQYTQALIKKLEDFAQFRCRRVARTETAKVENWAEVEGYREVGTVERKMWVSAFAPESRETHMSADGQEVALNEDFIVGSERMAYPGDPRGEAGNVVNCLCTVAPVID